MRGEIPQQVIFSRERAQSYRSTLWENRFLPPYPYGDVIELTRSSVDQLYQAARKTCEIVYQGIKDCYDPTKAGTAVTQWLEGHAPTFNNSTLNYDAINLQLEEKINKGWNMPFGFDVMLTLKDGKPRWSVIEIQTCTAPIVRQRELLSASGYNPDQENTWHGEKNPYQIIQELGQSIPNGEKIIIVDTEAFKGGDKFLTAKAMGSFPVSLTDIQEDEEGYFHFAYELDSERNPKVEQGEYKHTQEKVRIKHVLARMGQHDLDHLENLLIDNPQQKNLVSKFLADASINWIHHPSWLYVIEKNTMKFVRDKLLEQHDPVADMFVPIYIAGDVIPAGNYVLKPFNMGEGKGRSTIHIDENQTFIVPEGFVAQEEFIPYPVPMYIGGDYSSSFLPSDTSNQNIISEQMKEYFQWNSNVTPANLELRLLFPPGYESGIILIARIAPRWEPKGDRRHVGTNIPAIKSAIQTNDNIPEEEKPYLPFGLSPVVIKD